MKPARRQFLLRMAVSPFTWPLMLIYAAAVRLKNATYDSSLLKARRLSWPVLSVGNLSVGGTGKTPMVLLLSKLLQERGWSVNVLTRGYGRRSQNIERVNSRTEAETATATFGDEPLLMARRGLSVYVGADRHQAGQLAEADAHTNPHFNGSESRCLHILDDGLQHRMLYRNVNIVLVRRTDLNDDMVPAGRLREPLCALERADICVLRSEDEDLRVRVLQLMRQTDPARVWIVDRRTTIPATAASSRLSRAIAFCAIGDPSDFFRAIRQARICIEKEFSFRDHHAYTAGDIERLKMAARKSMAECFITTEKDSVRLSEIHRKALEAMLPVLIAGLELSIHNESEAMATLESLIQARHANPLQFHPDNVR